MATTPATRWQLEGTVTLACNCDYGCPCNFNARPTHGHCEGEWTWHVATGRHGAVTLDGLNFTLAADWPGAIHEGNGEAQSIIDERADAAQRDAIRRLLAGEDGPPWSMLRATLSVVHEPLYAAYEVQLDGVRSKVRAGHLLTLEMEPIKNPVSGAEAHPRILLPEGFVWKDGAVASSRLFRVRNGLRYDHSGKYAAVSAFDYRAGA